MFLFLLSLIFVAAMPEFLISVFRLAALRREETMTLPSLAHSKGLCLPKT